MAFVKPMVTIELAEYDYLKKIESQSQKDSMLQAVKHMVIMLIGNKAFSQKEAIKELHENGIKVSLKPGTNPYSIVAENIIILFENQQP